MKSNHVYYAAVILVTVTGVAYFATGGEPAWLYRLAAAVLFVMGLLYGFLPEEK